jgi:hypothetical protein
MADWVIMVIAIVAITTFGRIYAAKNGIRYRGKKGEGWEPAQTENRDNERLRLEVSQLKERIHTLERIATDKSRRLSDEIDSLGRD